MEGQKGVRNLTDAESVNSCRAGHRLCGYERGGWPRRVSFTCSIRIKGEWRLRVPRDCWTSMGDGGFKE